MDSNQVTPFDYNIYSFTPPHEGAEENFYNKSFDDKLKIVVEVIRKTGKIEASSENFNHKAIFIAPEYLFSNDYNYGHESYYSQEQKNEFKQVMLQVSKEIHMIIVPGTFRWWNQNEYGEKIYRNNAYL